MKTGCNPREFRVCFFEHRGTWCRATGLFKRPSKYLEYSVVVILSVRQIVVADY